MIVLHMNHKNIDKTHAHIDLKLVMFLHLTQSDIPSDLITEAYNHLGGSR